MSNQEIVIRTAYEKGYRVTDDGTIVSKKGVPLSINFSRQGYLSTSIRYGDGKKMTRCFLHRLQAFQKYGDEVFKDNIVVRHLNSIKTDNSFDNIAIGTQKDNMMDKPKVVRILGASHPIHSHLDILIDRNNGMSYSAIMEKYSISSKGTVSFIINKSLAKNPEKLQS